MSAEKRKKGETQQTLPDEAKMFSVATGLELWKVTSGSRTLPRKGASQKRIKGGVLKISISTEKSQCHLSTEK
jgi:hypothetical protein